MNHPTLSPFLLVAFSLHGLIAQSAPEHPVAQLTGSPLPMAICPVHEPLTDGRATGELWAAGASYKASFHDGVRFIPYLGAEYPRMQEVRWTTTSVRIGEHELLDGRPPRLATSNYRVEYDHGNVVEAYDVRSEGLEQTFVIARAPQTGDLTVRGELHGLRCEPRVLGHGPLVLSDAEGHPVVTYGAATAIDARGRHWPMTTWCEGSEVRLQLASADVATAVFPLLVDPLLSTGHSGPNGSSVASSEVAMATPTAIGIQPAYAYTRWVASGDSDLFLAGNNTNGIWFADLTVGASAEQPAVAPISANDKYLLVYRSLAAGVSRLRAHLRLQSDVSLRTTSIGLINASNVHDWRPTVGGIMDGASGDSFLVAFQREVTPTANFAETSGSSIVARKFNTATSLGQWSTEVVVAQGGANDCERPTVNQVAEGGSAFSWICIWQQFNNGIANDDWDLVGRRIDAAATLGAGTWTSSVGILGPRHQLGPKVAGHNGRYAVLFSTSDATVPAVGTAGQEIRIERFDWEHAAASPSVAGNYPAEIVSQGQSASKEPNGISMDSDTLSHWVYVFRQTGSTQFGFTGRVGFQGKALEGPVVAVVASGGGLSNLACAFSRPISVAGVAAIAYGQVASGTLTVYDTGLTQPSTSPLSWHGTVCRPSAVNWQGTTSHLDVAANHLIGSEFTALTITTPPSQNTNLHFPLLSFNTASLPILDPAVAQGCSLLVDTAVGYLGTLPLGFGASTSWNMPLPEHLPTMTLHFQVWSLDTSNLLFQSSQRLTVPLVR
ncbi:MAG: hypothetical protein IT456_11795 [Planctomycetes bacterium]|nr:hypothetical protein [Planctomycetota bacterium]